MKDGGTAFPANFLNDHGMPMLGISGISMRDYFAAHTLPAVCALSINTEGINDALAKTSAKLAYKMADAMLAEREKSK